MMTSPTSARFRLCLLISSSLSTPIETIRSESTYCTSNWLSLSVTLKEVFEVALVEEIEGFMQFFDSTFAALLLDAHTPEVLR